MILEVAMIEIRPGKNNDFEAAFDKGSAALKAARGFRTLTLQRCREWDFRYLMLVEWDKLEDHTVGFRESKLFDEWRSHVGKYFNGPPTVEHYEKVK
jgi:heme-degrading monooxygenase HmoA